MPRCTSGSATISHLSKNKTLPLILPTPGLSASEWHVTCYLKGMKKQSRKFQRKLAVVTGASSGIGFELAKEFALHNFDLILAAEDKGVVEAAEKLAMLGTTVNSIQVDLSTHVGVERLHQRIKKSGRVPDAVAINAGIGVNGDFARDTELKDEMKLIKLNVVSSVHLAKLVLKDMVKQNEGRILFTSSLASTTPGPYMAIYHASKAFIQSFAEGIRDELRDTNITVTSLLPGATETNFFHRAHMEDTPLGEMKKDDAAMVARQGFQALMEGRDMVVAGSFRNKITAMAARLVPQTWSAIMARMDTEPKQPRH